jgi:hypothetical protein
LIFLRGKAKGVRGRKVKDEVFMRGENGDIASELKIKAEGGWLT